MEKVTKQSVNYRPADGNRSCGNCVMFHVSHSASVTRLCGRCDLVEGEVCAEDVCDRWEAVTEKSAQTPELESTPDPLGSEGLWHTPSKKIPGKQKLPDYIEHIAHALQRDQGMDEQQAIATAINAVKRWAEGNLHWGHGKVTPEVQAASRRALQEWEHLKETHH